MATDVCIIFCHRYYSLCDHAASSTVAPFLDLSLFVTTVTTVLLTVHSRTVRT